MPLDGVVFSIELLEVGSHIGDVPLDEVVFSIELLEVGSHIFGFFGVRQFFIFTVSKRTRMFVL